jgi:photosystem II stability/assembly factor-like uncharacterized protein
MKQLSALIMVVAGSAFASGLYLGKGEDLSYAPTELASSLSASPQLAPSRSDTGFLWEQKFEGANWVIQDLSLGDAQTIFAAAELGKVLKSSDGGDTWTVSLNLGFPYYWYGAHAFDAGRAIISGFNNRTSEGLIRWTFDGGETWSAEEVLQGSTGWPTKILFVDDQIGMTPDLISAGIHITGSGGRQSADWSFVQAGPSGGWLQGNFTMLPDGNTWISGTNFCHSADYGAGWQCRPSIDSVFDGGGVSFPDTEHGWVAGGSISPTVEGWVHRTADGGDTWSDRILRAPFPIRSVLFLNPSLGFAVGGNIYTGVGGIYSTTDGGDSWTLDLSTGAEMRAIKALQTSQTTFDLWSAGFTGAPSFTGRIFRAQIEVTSAPR